MKTQYIHGLFDCPMMICNDQKWKVYKNFLLKQEHVYIYLYLYILFIRNRNSRIQREFQKILNLIKIFSGKKTFYAYFTIIPGFIYANAFFCK